MPNAGQKKMIPRANARNEAFSKRCSSIFWKATELSALCAVEMAIVIFSPGGRAYSFGSPCVEKIIDRFTHPGIPDAPANNEDASGMAELYKEYNDVLVQWDAEKKRGKKLKRRNFPIDDKDRDDLVNLKANLEILRNDIQKQIAALLSQNPVPTSCYASAGDASTSANPILPDSGC
ncbi:hypothetical protein L6164_019773 [Bauhinia variegata]|uniref:Uncharacterized protein n=1 Tax=Bauhinia variegata TaxID=167791 RepID=A0ACB9MUY5_BAUVA|nr:hypothetical protein L6164_019773 [Bauhinia variegata]